jgi:hypothetical protein
MRSIDLRIPLISGAALLMLAVSPVQAQIAAQPVALSAAAEEALAVDAVDAPAIAFADADRKDSAKDAQADMMAMADKMADPRMQDGVSKMLIRMTDTMMDLPIGNFAAALEKAMPGEKVRVKGKRVRAGDTIADLAGRDADRLPGKIDKGVHQAMGMMSGFAAAFATMIPEFAKMGDMMEKSFEDIEDASRDRNGK